MFLEGIEHAAMAGTVNIAKGSYNEPMYITKAVTLTAPVGKVIIGEAGFSARKASPPQGLELQQDAVDFQSETENSGIVLTLKTYPNPFVSSIAVDYSLPESTAVQVKVYDNLGNLVRSSTPGIYVVRIETPKGSRLQ